MAYFKSGVPATRFTWTAPTANVDGSPISGDLAYNLYVDGGVMASFPGTLNADGTYEVLFVDLPSFPVGEASFTLTAFYTSNPGAESVESGAVLVEYRQIPLAPILFGAD